MDLRSSSVVAIIAANLVMRAWRRNGQQHVDVLLEVVTSMKRGKGT